MSGTDRIDTAFLQNASIAGDRSPGLHPGLVCIRPVGATECPNETAPTNRESIPGLPSPEVTARAPDPLCPNGTPHTSPEQRAGSARAPDAPASQRDTAYQPRATLWVCKRTRSSVSQRDTAYQPRATLWGSSRPVLPRTRASRQACRARHPINTIGIGRSTRSTRVPIRSAQAPLTLPQVQRHVMETP